MLVTNCFYGTIDLLLLPFRADGLIIISLYLIIFKASIQFTLITTKYKFMKLVNECNCAK